MSFVKVNLVLKTEQQTDRPKYRSDLPSLKNAVNFMDILKNSDLETEESSFGN